MKNVSDMLNAYGLRHIASQLEQLTLPSIRMQAKRVQEDSLPVGRSKLGGLPDLPLDLSWPTWNDMPLAFLAQINITEVHELDVQGVLPSSGFLYFFYDAQHQPIGYNPAMRGGWRVLYVNEPLRALQRTPVPSLLLDKKSLWLPENQHYSACTLTFALETTLPPADALAVKELHLSEQLQKAYRDVLAALKQRTSEPIHRLLGYADALQGDMQIESQLVSHGLHVGDGSAFFSPTAERLKKEAQNWQLLVQLDTDDEAEMLWGIEGRIYYWIEADALRTRHFENTWVIMQWT